MPTINDSIGNRFEEIFLSTFPGFERKYDLPVLPDFFGNGFWIEAKVGNQDFGARLKEYQLVGFDGLNEPVVYAIGFHDFDNAGKRLTHPTEEGRQRFLRRHMNLVSMYFVSSQVINGIWGGESRLNKKGTIVYGLCKPRFLERVIDGGDFRRGGEILNAGTHYCINRDEFALQSPSNVGLNFPIGWILHEKQDEIVIDYLIAQGVIK